MLEQVLSYKMSQLQLNVHRLPHKQIHSLALQQEKIIARHVLETPRFDIYAQIARVCPAQADLRSLGPEEVATRIQFLSSTTSEPPLSSGRFNNSPGEEEGDGAIDAEPKIEGFCAFSQPSFRNFLDQVEQSSSLWHHHDYYPQ